MFYDVIFYKTNILETSLQVLIFEQGLNKT